MVFIFGLIDRNGIKREEFVEVVSGKE